MRLGLNVGYSGSQISLPIDLVQEADRLGFHSAWTAEAYGSDAVTPATIFASSMMGAISPPPLRARSEVTRLLLLPPDVNP